MLGLFADILLPVVLASGTGYLSARRFGLDPRPLSRIAFNVLAPCLIFEVIRDNEIAGRDVLRIAGLAVAVLLVSAGIAGAVASWMGCRRSTVAAVVLVVLLPNAGNFGLPTSLFAFGNEGMAHASIFFITSSIVTFTLGVLVASSGRTAPLAAALGLVRVPAVWSILIAVVVTGYGWAVPLPIERTIGLFSQASIPTFLLILGMQLHGIGLAARGAPLLWAVTARLLFSPALALVLTRPAGLEGIARQTTVLQSAMPCAVITIVFATEYELEPQFVTTAVFVSTLLSPLTLTPLLQFLGA